MRHRLAARITRARTSEAHGTKRGPLRHLSAVLISASFIALGLYAVASEPAGASSAWSAPSLLDANHLPYAASCATTAFCVAVDNVGDAVIFNYSSASAPTPIDPGNVLTDVSCPTTSFCAAVDQQGNVLTYDGSTWSSPLALDPTNRAASLEDISCPSASFCLATGSTSITFDGTSWSQVSGFSAGGISCASSTFCIGGDKQGHIYNFNGSTWSLPLSIDGSGRTIEATSCPTVTFCVAVDDAGQEISFNGTSWSSPVLISGPYGPNGFNTVSCPSATFCVAGAQDGDVNQFDGTTWSTPVRPDLNSIQSVSCLGPSFCAAVDQTGRALFYSGNTSSTTVVNSLSGDGQTGTTISVPLLTEVTDTASLSGTNVSSAGGTVRYTVYSDASCTVMTGSGGTVSVTDGTVSTSLPVTLTVEGTYYWQATYSGDKANATSASTCAAGGEVHVTPDSTSLSTLLAGGGQSGTRITVPEGTAVSDQATLGGTFASAAGGSVTYTVYSDSSCTTAVNAGTAESITVLGKLPVSAPVTLPSAGTYYWEASYSGDGHNAPSTSTCGAGSEVETLEATQPSGFRITTTSLPPATKGTVYSIQFQAAGGSTPFGWKRLSGSLPKGLRLRSNGLLHGTPRSGRIFPESFTFTVQAKTHRSRGNPVQTTTQTLVIIVSA